jgi:alpha-amylase
MVDVVANHMGMENEYYGDAVPFNNRNNYHSLCDISDNDFNTKNMWSIQNCRLSHLADLNTEDSYVQSTLYEWIRSIVNTYGFDGIRIDTVPHVPVDFWRQFT